MDDRHEFEKSNLKTPDVFLKSQRYPEIKITFLANLKCS